MVTLQELCKQVAYWADSEGVMIDIIKQKALRIVQSARPKNVNRLTSALRADFNTARTVPFREFRSSPNIPIYQILNHCTFLTRNDH